MWVYNNSDELMHYGVLGMKWGVRRANSLKKAIAANDRDVTSLKKAGYSKEAKAVKAVGDKNRNKLAKVQNKQKSATKGWSKDAKNANRIKTKSVKQMSNTELRQLNERTRLEREYSQLNPSTISKGAKFATAIATTTGTALTIYNNSDKIVNLGRKFVSK